MTVRRQDVVNKLLDYLNQRIALSDLVDWAENVIMEGEFEESDRETLRDIVSRLGLADVKAFNLTRDDCEEYLRQLGYQPNTPIVDEQEIFERMQVEVLYISREEVDERFYPSPGWYYLLPGHEQPEGPFRSRNEAMQDAIDSLKEPNNEVD